jgi:predicted DNA-binding transcriptional regulator AlpA
MQFATEATSALDSAGEPTRPPIELMDKDETCRFFGGHLRPINHATLYRGVKENRYPAPIKIGPNSSRWIKSECEAALAAIIAARPAPANAA